MMNNEERMMNNEEKNESDLLNTTPTSIMGSSRMNFKKSLFPVILILLILAALGVFLVSSADNSPGKPLTDVITKQLTPTPFPFQDMTIPYLRTKTFHSMLGERELYLQSSNYTSYLTSYTSDGLRINALLTEPSGQMPEGGWPAIVFLHGYIPPTQYVTTEKYTDYVDYLARNGFVVLKIDLRGHGESEGEAGGGYYGSDYISDALHAYSALQNSGFVNPRKVGMWGHSMAGNILLRSAAVKKDIPAIVIWAGAVYTYEDMRKYGISDQSYRPPQFLSEAQNRRRELFEKMGSPSASSPFWRQVAPIYYLNDLQGAIQLNHAVNDDVVNIGYSRDLNTLLDRTHVPHELHEYPSGGHNMTGTSFAQAMQNTVEFFKKYL